MRMLKSALFVAPVLALTVVPARDASACGGCFHNDIQQMENTQVTGHRMILSVSKTQSTLWDQIAYSGDPSSFAWVLPVKGMITYDVSSDALFGNLDQRTQVTINSPVINCPPPPFCGFNAAVGSTGPGGSSGSGVTVIAQKVVGPYDTAHLSSMDPLALKNWLAMHNYVIPMDIDPIIAAYVQDGFDFLAVKLIPGMGIKSMKPMRVTSQGASPVLPLRMVSAGTGTTVSLTLWVVGEGGYVTSNFPPFYIKEDQLVWDWTTMQSNYKDVRQAGYAQTMGKGWLVEASEAMSQFSLSDDLTYLAMYDPLNSGYADDMGMGAQASCAADLATLFAGISSGSTWISRLHGEMPRTALGTDLTLMASNQAPVQRNFTATKTTGTPPACPTYPPCNNSGSGGAGGGGGGNVEVGGCSGNCAASAQTDISMPLGLSTLALFAMAKLRRRMNRNKPRSPSRSS